MMLMAIDSYLINTFIITAFHHLQYTANSLSAHRQHKKEHCTLNKFVKLQLLFTIFFDILPISATTAAFFEMTRCRCNKQFVTDMRKFVGPLRPSSWCFDLAFSFPMCIAYLIHRSICSLQRQLKQSCEGRQQWLLKHQHQLSAQITIRVFDEFI